jgi:hypothetical protein
MTKKDTKRGFGHAPIKTNSDEHKKATEQAASEKTKRTNLTIGLKSHMALKLLTECLNREDGRKVTMDKLYSEAIADLLVKYNEDGEGKYIMLNNEDYSIFKEFIERESLGTIKE